MEEIIEAALALIRSLDGTMGRTWKQKHDALLANPHVEEVNPQRLARLMDALFEEHLLDPSG